MLDPVTLYKDGACKKIPAIDHRAWINAGWSLTETSLTFLSEGGSLEEGASMTEGEEVLSEEISNPPSDKKVETNKRKSLNQ
ncbi:MAG: hypothetical protein KME29_04805 [Calothrix sp. FI2-JRJ7]|jgi:hypothetical protein|nr:hypothetical protein [Calothrix sp. FI2-JRJ7]